MPPKKKSGFLSKTVPFGKQKLTLYSIDGVTWSTRCKELAEIQARHEREKITFNDIKGIDNEEENKENSEKAGESEEGGGYTEYKSEDEQPPKKRGPGRKPGTPAAQREEPARGPLAKVKGKEAAVAARAGKSNQAPLASANAKKPAPAKAGKSAVAAPKKRASATPARFQPKSKAKKHAA